MKDKGDGKLRGPTFRNSIKTYVKAVVSVRSSASQGLMDQDTGQASDRQTKTTSNSDKSRRRSVWKDVHLLGLRKYPLFPLFAVEAAIFGGSHKTSQSGRVAAFGRFWRLRGVQNRQVLESFLMR